MSTKNNQEETVELAAFWPKKLMKYFTNYVEPEKMNRSDFITKIEISSFFPITLSLTRASLYKKLYFSIQAMKIVVV